MPSFDKLAAKYKALRLNSTAESLTDIVRMAEENEISYLQFADMLVTHELSSRDKKRILKHLEEFDYRFQTTVTKKQISRLLDFTFIDNRENIIFIGTPGVGKTHLAIGIGIKAVEAGYKVMFTTAMALIETLELAELKGELKKKINAIIIDELGYLPMNRKGMFNLFQLINALYEYRSVILTTNKNFTSWGDFFFDDNVAVPVVDRLIHHSHIFMLGGDSYRLKQKTSA